MEEGRGGGEREGSGGRERGGEREGSGGRETGERGREAEEGRRGREGGKRRKGDGGEREGSGGGEGRGGNWEVRDVIEYNSCIIIHMYFYCHPPSLPPSLTPLRPSLLPTACESHILYQPIADGPENLVLEVGHLCSQHLGQNLQVAFQRLLAL